MSLDDYRSGEVLSSSDEGSNEGEDHETSLNKAKKLQKLKQKHAAVTRDRDLKNTQIQGLHLSMVQMQEMNKSLAMQLESEKKSSKENTERLKEKKERIKELELQVQKLEEANRTLKQKVPIIQTDEMIRSYYTNFDRMRALRKIWQIVRRPQDLRSYHRVFGWGQ